MHRNCFDFARHLMALMVLISHHYALNGLTEPHIDGSFIYGMKHQSIGAIAVLVFFSISGYLVTKSFNRCEGMLDYAEKRVRRLFPGLIVCCAILVFLVMPIYVKSDGLPLFDKNYIKSFINGISLLQPNFPYPTAAFKHHNIINGSLWTLASEFACYFIVAIALLYSKSWKAPLTLILGVIFLQVSLISGLQDFTFYQTKFSRFLPFILVFSIGSLMAITEKSWSTTRARMIIFIVCPLIIFAISKQPEAFVIGNAAFAALVITFCTALKVDPIKGRFDISYGIYIYAWPIQQIVSNELSTGFYMGMAISLCLTIIAASLSWRFVESPFLRRRKSELQAGEQAVTG